MCGLFRVQKGACWHHSIVWYAGGSPKIEEATSLPQGWLLERKIKKGAISCRQRPTSLVAADHPREVPMYFCFG